MRRRHAALPFLVALALTGPTAGESFTHVEVRDVSAEVGTPAGLRTWRFLARFDTVTEHRLLAVEGTPDHPLVFETNDPEGIMNDPDGSFVGLTREDFATAPLTAAWDTWVTIGATTFAFNDTVYGPTFLDNDGVHAVLVDGLTWFIEDDDGWFDLEPGTPETGTAIVIAQFTVRAGYGVRLAGRLDYDQPYGGPTSPRRSAPPRRTSPAARATSTRTARSRSPTCSPSARPGGPALRRAPPTSTATEWSTSRICSSCCRRGGRVHDHPTAALPRLGALVASAVAGFSHVEVHDVSAEVDTPTGLRR